MIDTKTADNDREHLDEALTRIEENALYTGQAHFEIAARESTRNKWLLVAASAVSGTAGLLVAIGLPGWIGTFSAVAGAITGVASALGIERSGAEHETAGKQLTGLRHEAKDLRTTLSPELGHSQYAAEVRRLMDRYNSLVQILALTENNAFEKVRARIRAGTFDYE